jgi:hypothetical protein
MAAVRSVPACQDYRRVLGVVPREEVLHELIVDPLRED